MRGTLSELCMEEWNAPLAAGWLIIRFDRRRSHKLIDPHRQSPSRQLALKALIIIRQNLPADLVSQIVVPSSYPLTYILRTYLERYLVS